MYKLIATNRQGAKVFMYGDTQKDALRKFKALYYLKGWLIEYDYLDISNLS